MEVPRSLRELDDIWPRMGVVTPPAADPPPPLARLSSARQRLGLVYGTNRAGRYVHFLLPRDMCDYLAALAEISTWEHIYVDDVPF